MFYHMCMFTCVMLRYKPHFTLSGGEVSLTGLSHGTRDKLLSRYSLKNKK